MMQQEHYLALSTQVKRALQAMKDVEETEETEDVVIHPADQQFADMLLMRSMEPAIFLDASRKLLRTYRVFLEAIVGVRVPVRRISSRPLRKRSMLV